MARGNPRGGKRALIVAIVLFAGAASANTWQHAIESGRPDAARDVYEAKLRTGDDLAVQANTRGQSRANVTKLVQLAADSYREASTAEPGESEPYYRLGALLYSFYMDCSDRLVSTGNGSPLCPPDPSYFDRTHAQEVIDAWDAFEARAPLDPRLGVTLGDSEILFKRAIMHTRLVTKPHLAAAARDYEKILARSDGSVDGVDETVLSNLAETYMMLDRLDDAVDTYREALRTNQHTETIYGLAVALDRDERSDQARDLIASQGEASLEQFHQRVAAHITFFVPRGEEYYYFALGAEVFGQNDEAVRCWNEYIRSGAHPEFQPRAKAHLDALLSKRKRPVIPFEPRWQELMQP